MDDDREPDAEGPEELEYEGTVRSGGQLLRMLEDSGKMVVMYVVEVRSGIRDGS